MIFGTFQEIIAAVLLQLKYVILTLPEVYRLSFPLQYNSQINVIESNS